VVFPVYRKNIEAAANQHSITFVSVAYGYCKSIKNGLDQW
jgi:hypothetical protein